MLMSILDEMACNESENDGYAPLISDVDVNKMFNHQMLDYGTILVPSAEWAEVQSRQTIGCSEALVAVSKACAIPGVEAAPQQQGHVILWCLFFVSFPVA